MKKLLLGVDDSLMNRTLFEEVKNYIDIDVAVAVDGEDGLSLLNALLEEGRKPDLIITDINMPKMDGIVFIEELKKIPKAKYIPVLVLTTEEDYEMKIESKNLGAAGWIQKPLSPEEIAEIMKRFVSI